MKLCITEKPSVGADIARILGATSRHDGYFEGNGYCVTWTFGHLCMLKEPHDYSDRWKRWSLGALPMIPQRFGIKVIHDKGIEHQFDVIRTLIGKADEIINCGDAGQEGELIQRWVMQKAGCEKPVSRLWINSLTDDSIREGFAKLRPHAELEPLYTAGLCRAIGDWVLGMNATRLYSLKYGQAGRVLSVGRVQTPTLALVVQRQRDIESFVPTDSWVLKTRYRDALFTATTDPFPTEEEGQRAMAEASRHPLCIDSITKKKGRESHPRLFDLTSLQVECNARFGMSAEQTLKTIQSLYEKKATTYPRVDTTFLPDDVFKKCGPILNSLKDFTAQLQPLRGQKLRKSKRAFDNSKGTDHHAIIPTGAPTPALSAEERKVFDTIALRFISIFYPDCEFEQTAVEAHAGSTPFKATGRVILKPGWKALYAKEKASPEKDDDDSDATTTLPAFTKGESGPHESLLAKRTTQPPRPYTEGTLLKAMETAGSNVEDEELRDALKANGIGRPSTRANIIELLYKRGYIARKGKAIQATPAGCELIDIIHEDLLKDVRLTGIWEGRLRAIERGEYSAQEFVDGLKQMISEITLQVLRDNSNRHIAPLEKQADKGAAKPAKGNGRKKKPTK